jgi:hypothetical protein
VHSSSRVVALFLLTGPPAGFLAALAFFLGVQVLTGDMNRATWRYLPSIAAVGAMMSWVIGGVQSVLVGVLAARRREAGMPAMWPVLVASAVLTLPCWAVLELTGNTIMPWQGTGLLLLVAHLGGAAGGLLALRALRL